MAIGVNPIEINSALVSAQNRRRLYWTNIGMKPAGLFGDLESIIVQPKDRGILLKDILISEVDEKYFLSDKMLGYLTRNSLIQKEKGNGFEFNPTDGDKKGKAVTTKAGSRMDDEFIVHNTMPRSGDPKKGGTGHLSRNDGKTYYLDTGNTNAIEILNDNQLAKFNPNIDADKSNTLTLAISRRGSSSEYMDSISKIAKLTSRIRIPINRRIL